MGLRALQRPLSLIPTSLARVLLPPLCPLCRQPLPSSDPLLCPACSAGLRELEEPYCTVCGLPFSGIGPSHPCPRCVGERSPFETLRAWGLYRGGLREAIQALKYRGDLSLRKTLERFFVQAFDRHCEPGSFSWVVPVPCHDKTLRTRGFDLPALLARKVGRARGISWRPTALLKTRVTPDLVGLAPRERQESVRGAYRPREFLDGSVLLVDDVATSTATARACAEAAREAGAGKVCVLVLARTPLEGA